MGTLQRLIRQNLTFDDVRDSAVEVCYNVTAAMGYDGVIMCPGIIDNYGPHVYTAKIISLVSIGLHDFVFLGVLRP